MKDSMKALGEIGSNTGERKQDSCVLISEMQELAESNSEIMSGSKAGYYNLNCHLSWVFIDETLERKLFYIACP